MSEAAEKFVKYLGFELNEETTAEELQKWGEENLVNVDKITDHPKHKQILGERMGSNQTALKTTFKEAGVTFEKGNNDRYEDILRNGVSFFSNKITELESAVEAAKSGSPDKSKELEDKITEIHDLKKSIQDLTKSKKELLGTIEEKDTLLAGAQKEKENFIFSSLLRESKDKIGLDPNLKSREVKGFFAEMNEKYTTKLVYRDGEDDTKIPSLEIRDNKGELVSDPNNHGETLNYVGVFKMEAAKEKLLKVNDKGGDKQDTIKFDSANKNGNSQPQPTKPKVTIAQGGSTFSWKGR